MEAVQLYETEIADLESDRAVRFIVVPRRSLKDPEQDPYDVMRSLELEQIARPLPPSLVSVALASVLQGEEDANYAAEHLQLMLRYREEFARDHPKLAEFVEYVSYANVLPAEASPLSSTSLASVLAGSGVGIGAVLGFMVAGGSTPLLLLAVPAGMILCGSAKGIAEGLDAGFRYRIRNLMGVPPDSAPSPGTSPEPAPGPVL